MLFNDKKIIDAIEVISNVLDQQYQITKLTNMHIKDIEKAILDLNSRLNRIEKTMRKILEQG